MSGARNCPETPRQRMIGMMYLVLTAMLALNVSSEVLQGFTMVDNTLQTTIESSDIRVDAMFEDFNNIYNQNPTKVKEWLDKANQVKEKSDSLYDYIQNFKYQMIKLADKDKADPAAKDIKAKDNFDVPGQYGLVQGHGKELKQKLSDYQDFMFTLTEGDKLKQSMYKKMFGLDKVIEGQVWEEFMFQMMPLSAVSTLLTKYQSDIRIAQLDVVQYLKAQTDASDFRVNKIQAYVIPDSKYVIKGGKFSARIVLAAEDSTKIPEYYVNNTLLKNGLYTVQSDVVGLKPFSGRIDVMGNDGIKRSYPFKEEYMVGEPSATISNEDLNVVYRGIENKFSISVPGVAAENVDVSVSGGTAQKTGSGKYIIKPTQDQDITIVVSANIDGRKQQMGSSKYRVKYIPDPKSYVQYRDAGGVVRLVQEGRLSKALIKDGDFQIVASYGEDELIKANFTVTSFTMTTIFGSVDSQSGTLTKRQLDDINRLERNDIVTFKNIKAKGPDGKVRSGLGVLQVEI